MHQGSMTQDLLQWRCIGWHRTSATVATMVILIVTCFDYASCQSRRVKFKGDPVVEISKLRKRADSEDITMKQYDRLIDLLHQNGDVSQVSQFCWYPPKTIHGIFRPSSTRKMRCGNMA